MRWEWLPNDNTHLWTISRIMNFQDFHRSFVGCLYLWWIWVWSRFIILCTIPSDIMLYCSMYSWCDPYVTNQDLPGLLILFLISNKPWNRICGLHTIKRLLQKVSTFLLIGRILRTFLYNKFFEKLLAWKEFKNLLLKRKWERFRTERCCLLVV